MLLTEQAKRNDTPRSKPGNGCCQQMKAAIKINIRIEWKKALEADC
jgi:hypothetical protein